MILPPRLRRLGLTAHITTSLGWFGAVTGFLALGIAGLSSDDSRLVRASYLAMELVGWFVIVPFGIASFLSGVVQSLGTRWGLFRHYWVVAKLLITIVATLLLLLHMGPTSRLAEVAANTSLSLDEVRDLRIQLVADAGAAIFALLLATALAIYKPRGLTPYGRRVQGGSRAEASATGAMDAAGTTQWARTLAIAILVLLAVFLVLHLAGGGLGNHRAMLPSPHAHQGQPIS